MPGKVRCHQNRAMVAQSQETFNGTGPHLHGRIFSQRVKQRTRVFGAHAAETGSRDRSHPRVLIT
jgi:hypothetical protein